MSITIHPGRTSEPSPWSEPMRWGAVGLLLVVELLAVTIRYDAQSISSQGWLGELATATRNLPKIALALGVAFLLAKQASSTSVEAIGGNGERPTRRLVPAAIAHLATFALFFLLTGRILEGASDHRGAWLVVWWATGAVSAVCAALIVRPAEAWASLLIGLRPHALATGAIALGAWVFSRLTPLLWKPLGGATLALAGGILRPFFSEVVVDSRRMVLGTGDFSVRIAPDCSGYEGVGLILMFLSAFLWLSRRSLRFPSAFWMLPMGVAAIWTLNVIRIAGLVAIGATVSPSIALGGFHSQAGWLAFNAVGLGLVFLARRCRLFAKAETVAAGEAAIPAFESTDASTASPLTFGPTAAYLAPLLALVLAGMIGTAFSSGFDYLYPLKAVAVFAALWLTTRREGVQLWSRSLGSVALGGLVFLVWMLLEPTPTASSSFDQGLARLPLAGQWAWLFARVSGSVLAVPIAEELAFRGYVPRRLVSSDFASTPPGRFTFSTLLVSSVLFGLMHGRAVAGTIAGLAYAFALFRRGKIGDAILAHAVTNLLIAVYVLGTGHTSVWT